MAANIEIERKFLITRRPDGTPDRFHKIRQGYIAREGSNSVRIRARDDHYILSVKTPRNGGGRNELEYEISPQEGEILFNSLTHAPIIKTREIYKIEGLIWEVDIFEGANKGLIIVEVELNSTDQKINIPPWVGPEVTELSKFYNGALVNMPFEKWRIGYKELVDRMSG